ncbi:hypothetical protein Tsp_01686 [Trichinella spiralis]|uniref:hypothetical protein n=1 Tax=Trichinella spiralis TaxID=6334 RepID=UPI0001EFC69C|nr:hypothetical protein Tsp_01686 [Trichinella spiralis]
MFGSTLVGPCLPVYMLCAFVRTFLDNSCLLHVQTRSLPVHVSERSYITSSVSLCDEKVPLNSEDLSCMVTLLNIVRIADAAYIHFPQENHSGGLKNYHCQIL